MSAESSERNIGRVVIELRPGLPNAIALETAMRLAQAFKFEIRGLFIDNEEMETLSELTITRTVSFSGKTLKQPSRNEIEREALLAVSSMRRQFNKMAERAMLQHQFMTVRDHPVRAIRTACDRNIGETILVLTERLALHHLGEIQELLVSAENLWGILMVAPGAKRRTGPVILKVESMDGVSKMLKSAELLASPENGAIILVTDEDSDVLGKRSAELYETVDPSSRVQVLSAQIPDDRPDLMRETIRRLRGGLVIAEFGGSLVQDGKNLKALANALDCPLMITTPSG